MTAITTRQEGQRGKTPRQAPRSGDDQKKREGNTAPANPGERHKGMLDVTKEGFGFLRTEGYTKGKNDVFVPARFIKEFGLRAGDIVEGYVRAKRAKDKFPGIRRVLTCNGIGVGNEDVGEPGDGQSVSDETLQDNLSALLKRPHFEDMTPIFPDDKLRLEIDGRPDKILPRIVDLVAPIGKGQRAIIVSPPKAGKTTVLKEIAQAISLNHPECYLMVVLIDERPEEVTDMARSVNGEVIASTFDKPATEHTQIADLAIERAKRLVEHGMDVVVLLDSITRLARAYNLTSPTTSRILSGGVDAGALYPPKRFFGTARNIENGGSLTIVATALVETGSRMDDVIFEEFKGTGNMELRLSRSLADKRIYPAIDVAPSGTRREELLLDKADLARMWKLRRVLVALSPDEALGVLADKLKAVPSNRAFLESIDKAGS